MPQKMQNTLSVSVILLPFPPEPIFAILSAHFQLRSSGGIALEFSLLKKKKKIPIEGSFALFSSLYDDPILTSHCICSPGSSPSEEEELHCKGSFVSFYFLIIIHYQNDFSLIVKVHALTPDL
ncbi:hypothetical protein ABFS82_11G081700 [Erythranthe guttata]